MAQRQRKNQTRPGTGTQPARERATRGQEGARHATGRRARQREAETEATRRRLTIGLGAGTIVVVVAIVVAALLLNRPNTGPTETALTDPSTFNPKPNGLPVGSKAPDFNLATVGGTYYRLSALRGHPVLIEMFAVWCPHCQRESAVLNQLEKSYGPSGLRTLAMLASPYGKDYDSSGGTDLRPAAKSDISWFTSTFQVTHPILIDPAFATVNRYGLVASGYPTIFVLDRNGIIRYAKSGEIPYAGLAAAVKAAGA